MDKEIEIYELIEQYLQGKLIGDDLLKFESRITTEPEFAAEVEKHKEFHNFIFERAMIEMKDQVNKIHQVNSGGIGRIGWRNLFSYFGAVFFTVLVFLGINGKMKYDDGSLFSSFRKKGNVTSVDSTLLTTVPVQPKKKSSKTTTQTAVDTASISDTTMVTEDTVYYTQAETEMELSEILNSAVSNVQPESKPIDEISKSPVQKSNLSVTDCDKVDIEADISAENSCEDKATGKIKVDRQSVRGGEAPYSVSVDGGKNYYEDYSVSNLSAAKYQVYIRDANNCASKIGNITIKAIDCSNEYVFAPDKGEVWEIPSGENSGEIKIYNKQGKIVYTSDFDTPGNYEWDGRTNSGGELPMGAYMFVLKLGNGETVKGNVTIVR